MEQTSTPIFSEMERTTASRAGCISRDSSMVRVTDRMMRKAVVTSDISGASVPLDAGAWRLGQLVLIFLRPLELLIQQREAGILLPLGLGEFVLQILGAVLVGL